MVRKIVEKFPEDLLEQDLNKYQQKAIEFGATDAKIITNDMILIDERVRAKCFVPVCRHYGTNAVCPPNAMELDLFRKVVNNFRYALFFMIKVPSTELAHPEFIEKKKGARTQVLTWEICAKIESEAFYDGHHLAMAFASGPCLPYLCPGEDVCALLAGKGSCRGAYKARSAMEAVGMDAFRMAAKVGWEVYPIGEDIPPSEVPHGARLGLVLIH
jgi:predicted metal-binding protein